MKLWVHWHKTVDSIHSVCESVCAYFSSRVSCQYGYITSLYLSTICTINHLFFRLNRYYCIVLLRRWIRPSFFNCHPFSNAMLRRIEHIVTSWSCCLFVYLLHLFLLVHQVVLFRFLFLWWNWIIFIKFSFSLEFFTIFLTVKSFVYFIKFLKSRDRVNDFWICGKFSILVRCE